LHVLDIFNIFLGTLSSLLAFVGLLVQKPLLLLVLLLALRLRGVFFRPGPHSETKLWGGGTGATEYMPERISEYTIWL